MNVFTGPGSGEEDAQSRKGHRSCAPSCCLEKVSAEVHGAAVIHASARVVGSGTIKPEISSRSGVVPPCCLLGNRISELHRTALFYRGSARFYATLSAMLYV